MAITFLLVAFGALVIEAHTSPIFGGMIKVEVLQVLSAPYGRRASEPKNDGLTMANFRTDARTHGK